MSHSVAALAALLGSLTLSIYFHAALSSRIAYIVKVRRIQRKK